MAVRGPGVLDEEDGTVPAPLSLEIGGNQSRRQESEETGSWATPLRAAVKLCCCGLHRRSRVKSPGLHRAVRKALPSVEATLLVRKVRKNGRP